MVHARQRQVFQFILFQLSSCRPGMWNEPTREQLATLPRLYASECTPWQETVIHEHFFFGGCDWYAAEYSPDERIFFGYAILNNDFRNAEWGYISFDELRDLKIGPGIEVDRDLHWKPRKASEIEEIVQGMS